MAILTSHRTVYVCSTVIDLSSGRLFITLFSFSSDLCQVPILYYANSSVIYSYNTKDGDFSPNLILRLPDTQLVYDKHNRQMLTYISAGTLSRVTLDGLNITTLATNEEFIRRFTYDGRRNIIYYLHDARQTIYMLNLTSMEDKEVGALSHISNIKDLDIDVLNG